MKIKKMVDITNESLTAIPEIVISNLWLVELIKQLESEDCFKLSSNGFKPYRKMIEMDNHFYSIEIHRGKIND